MNSEQLLEDPPITEAPSVAPETEIVENLDKPRTDTELTPEASTQQKAMMLTAVIMPFVGLIIATVLLWQVGMVSWEYIAMVVGGWLITTLGITIGFHRLCSHKSFDTYPWVRLVWTALGTMSIEGAPLTWCAVHRRHHSHSDQRRGPAFPKPGRLWILGNGQRIVPRTNRLVVHWLLVQAEL